jgi:hypothetical protein
MAFSNLEIQQIFGDMEQPPKNYMSLEVFQNYGLFRRKQRTVPCDVNNIFPSKF